jgi:hypothetical protein
MNSFPDAGVDMVAIYASKCARSNVLERQVLIGSGSIRHYKGFFYDADYASCPESFAGPDEIDEYRAWDEQNPCEVALCAIASAKTKLQALREMLGE